MTISEILNNHGIIIWNGYVLDISSIDTRLKPLSDFKTVSQALDWLGY